MGWVSIIDRRLERRLSLLIGVASVSNPTVQMPSLWVMVGPVYDASFIIPFVLSVKSYFLARFQRPDFGCEIDIVGDQQGLTGVERYDESLVSAAIQVIRKHLGDDTSTLDLNIALPLLESFLDLWRIVLTDADEINKRGLAVLIGSKVEQCQDDDDKQFFHLSCQGVALMIR